MHPELHDCFLTCDCRYLETLPKRVLRFFAFLDPRHTVLPPIFAATVTLTFAPSRWGETTAVIFSPHSGMLIPVLKVQE